MAENELKVIVKAKELGKALDKKVGEILNQTKKDGVF